MPNPTARNDNRNAFSYFSSLLDREAASGLAKAEGLVTHLTSLVLVDESAEDQDGLPAARML